ncbi:Retrovirus-related Pol polyprotein from transposon [Halotydeus destructor]|nr:Retrovirus-related Pol polyprotein from transposon [Halotydeus destructor]
MVKTNKQNEYLLVLTDRLTKYVIAKPVKAANAISVANFLMNDFILIHGPPRMIISDNGTEFLNQVITKLLATMNVAHRRTPAYHPMANGQTECFNRSWKQIVSSYVDNQAKNWDALSKYATLAYNSSVHESTKISPYFAVHAREPRTFSDLRHSIGELDTTLKERINNYHAVKKYMNQNIEKSNQKFKEIANIKRRHVNFRSGDQVLRRVPVIDRQLGKTFSRPYQGPFTVLKRLGHVTYVIGGDGKNRRWNKMKVHVKDLRPFVQREVRSRINEDIDETSRGGVISRSQSQNFDQLENATERHAQSAVDTTKDVTCQGQQVPQEIISVANDNAQHTVRRSTRPKKPVDRLGL